MDDIKVWVKKYGLQTIQVFFYIRLRLKVMVPQSIVILPKQTQLLSLVHYMCQLWDEYGILKRKKFCYYFSKISVNVFFW